MVKENGPSEEFGGFGAKLISIKTYKKDSLNGLWKEYYTHWIWQPECTNPSLKTVSYIKDGKPKGGSEDYYVDSIVKKEMYYKNGKPNGLSKEFYKNGKLENENAYMNGKLDGLSMEYYSNGKLKSEKTYKNDKLNGVVKEYYESGFLIKESNFTNGFAVGIWKEYYDSGEVKRETPYNYALKNEISPKPKDTITNKPRVSKSEMLGFLLGQWKSNSNGDMIKFDF